MALISLLPFLSFALSSITIALLRYPAICWGLTDHPGGRKQHVGVVPLTGGLGVFVGFLLVQPLLSVPVEAVEKTSPTAKFW